MNGRRTLTPDRWPALSAFFRGYLHQDAAEEHGSVEHAFATFWADANAAERAAFATEWRSVRPLIAGRAWHRVQPRIAPLGLAWMPRGGTGFAQLARAIDQTLREHI